MSNWNKTYNNITWANNSSPYLNASNLNANQGWIKELKDRSEELYARSSVAKQEEIEALAVQVENHASEADADAKDAQRYANLASASATSASQSASEAVATTSTLQTTVNELIAIVGGVNDEFNALYGEVDE